MYISSRIVNWRLLLAGALVLILTACNVTDDNGSDDDNNGDPDNGETENGET